MIRLKEEKLPQHNYSIETFFGASTLFLPLSQHTGRPSRPIARPSDTVEEASIIAENDGLISACLSAPHSGKIMGVSLANHPILGKTPAIVLKCQGQRNKYILHNLDKFNKKDILEIIRKAGIVGMGGASFPTVVKLNPPKPIDTLIINGCECEPYLACDYRLMVEQAEDIFRGVEIVCRLLNPKRVIFAIEDNKSEAIKKFNRLISTRKFLLPEPKVAILPTRYPQGGEKQLIYTLTRRRVPLGSIPFEVGCLVDNVGTIFAIYQAVYLKKPLIERVVTFAGDALVEPKNIRIKLGTTLRELFNAGVLKFKQEPAKIIYGGPMMGIALSSLDYPILKGTSGILFLSLSQVDIQEESNCIHCSRCVDSCPMRLLPLEFVKRVKHNEYGGLNDFYIKDCIECGVCSYVCPAKIPLVHYIKLGKKYAVNN